MLQDLILTAQHREKNAFDITSIGKFLGSTAKEVGELFNAGEAVRKYVPTHSAVGKIVEIENALGALKAPVFDTAKETTLKDSIAEALANQLKKDRLESNLDSVKSTFNSRNDQYKINKTRLEGLIKQHKESIGNNNDLINSYSRILSTTGATLTPAQIGAYNTEITRLGDHNIALSTHLNRHESQLLNLLNGSGYTDLVDQSGYQNSINKLTNRINAVGNTNVKPYESALKELKDVYKQDLTNYTNTQQGYTNDLSAAKDKLNTIGGTIALGTGAALLGGAGYVGNILKARNANKLLETLDPVKQGIVSEIGVLDKLGVKAIDVKSLVEGKLRNQEYSNKLLDAVKTELETEKLEHDVEKHNTLLGALSRSSVGQILTPLIGGAALGLGGLALGKTLNTLGGLHLPNPIQDTVIEKGLNEAIKLRPALAGLDHKMLKNYFSIIFEYAPHIASNPSVASNLLERMVNYGGPDHNLLKELAETERAIKDPLKSQYDALGAGFNLMGMAR